MANDAQKFTTTGRSLDSGQKIFLHRQVAISIAINALIPTAIIWMVGVPPPHALLGDGGILPGMIMASGLATLFMTFGLTLVVRASVRRGEILPLALGSVGALSRRLPSHLLARSLSMALVAVVLLVPCGVALLGVFPLFPLSGPGFILWNVSYGAVVGLTMAPLVVRRALADARGRALNRNVSTN